MGFNPISKDFAHLDKMMVWVPGHLLISPVPFIFNSLRSGFLPHDIKLHFQSARRSFFQECKGWSSYAQEHTPDGILLFKHFIWQTEQGEGFVQDSFP